jgi:hypothetical protein
MEIPPVVHQEVAGQAAEAPPLAVVGQEEEDLSVEVDLAEVGERFH